MPNLCYQLLSLVVKNTVVAAFLLLYFVIRCHTFSLKDSQKDSQKLTKKSRHIGDFILARGSDC
jgi:hypothetical protein